MANELLQTLHSLPATGTDGFEGLTVRLLERLSGLRFHLARSGNQQGRDARSELPKGGSIAVECKRYGIGNDLNSREVLAELQQAISSIPSLDLWILAATRSIPDQILSELLTFAADKGVDILALDSQADGTGTLDLLCAAFPEVLAQLCPSSSAILESILAEIRSNGGFDQRLNHLRSKLLSPACGWPTWQEQSHRIWQDLMCDPLTSRARLGQPLSILSPEAYSVPRQFIASELDRWWSGSRMTIFAVTGEEGDGKSWAVAQWLTAHTAPAVQRDFPPLIFIPSKEAGSARSLIDLVEQNLNQHFDGMQWRRRLNRWLESPMSRGEGPVAVVVLDGLGERHSPAYWRDLLEGAFDSKYVGLIAVVCTTRARYWKEHFSTLSHIQTTLVKVAPFSDEELSEALSARKKSLSNYPADLRPLLRKPRYLDLVTRHSHKMVESGDFTVARLVFEDWRDRRSRRDQHLSEEAFNDLLKQLAVEYRNGNLPVRGADLTAMLSPEVEPAAVVRELSTGGVLVSDGGRWKVDESRLSFALGLLLCDYLEKIDEGDVNADDEIASWLEPHTGSDIESAILEYAFLCSVSRGLPGKTVRNLLLAWISAQNPRSPRGAPLEEGITAYFPQAFDAFISVAETIWSEDGDNPWAQEVFLKGFVQWSIRSVEIAQRMLPILERWLSMFSVAGPHLLDGPIKSANHQQDIEEKLKSLLGDIAIGTSCSLAGYQLLPIKDRLWLRLGRVALSIISQFRDRRPYVQALVQGVLANAVSESGGRADEIKWLIRSSQTRLESDLDIHIKVLMSAPSPACQKAAAYLLRYLGSESAWTIRQSMNLDELFPTPDWVISVRDNPVESAFTPSSRREIEDYSRRSEMKAWAFIRSAQIFMNEPELSLAGDIKEKLLPCLTTIDPAVIWKGPWRGAEDLRFDEIERVFLRVDPFVIADLINAMCRTVGDRSPQALLSFGYQLGEYDLLLDDASREALRLLLLSRAAEFNLSDQTESQIEYQFFEPVLWLWEGREQLDHILSRSEDAFDNRDFTHSYRGTISEPIPTPASEKEWFRALYYLGTIGSAVLSSEQLNEACSSLSNVVRGASFRYVWLCSIESELSIEFDRQWQWAADQHDFEQYYGSLLLIRKMARSGPGDWIGRVDPSQRSTALNAASASDEDWSLYLKWLDTSLEAMRTFTTSTDAPRRRVECGNSERTLSGDVRLDPEPSQSLRFVAQEAVWGGRFSEWPPKWPADPETERLQRTSRYAEMQDENRKAIAAGHFWLQRCFPKIGLDRAIALQPSVVNTWIEQLEHDRALAALAGSFYVSLIEILAERDDWHAAVLRIYRALKSAGGSIHFIDGETQLGLLDIAVFGARETDAIRQFWIEQYDSCNRDADLLQLGMLIRKNGAHGSLDWLKRHIDGELASEIPYERAKAIALQGFVEHDERVLGLGNNPGEDVAWIDEVRLTARRRMRAEAFAKHWFSRFCTAEALVDAWAAYRLFLLSADRRCLLWCYDDMRELHVGIRKEAFFATNIQRLHKALRENEKKLAEEFLNCKVDESLAPWMRISA
jgi:hypothetical protein